MQGKTALMLFGALAILGHCAGMATDVYSGFAAGVRIGLVSATSLSFEHVAPLFQAISLADARTGHYLAVLFIPLGIFGVLQIFAALNPRQHPETYALLLFGILTVVHGMFFHGSLAFVAGALQTESELLPYFNSLSQPFGKLLLAGDVLVSGIFVLIAAFRVTVFPRLFALWNPVLIQAALLMLIALAPYPLDHLLWLTLFNASLALWYLGTTIVIGKSASPDLPDTLRPT
ncbi:hypothetical protein [Lentisalinibacter sediminis]|uniref:hypothetical protein n=1 Tax=Lentisalinibacter sediminis TaxID=2992237 RepID=UPI00386FC2CD